MFSVIKSIRLGRTEHIARMKEGRNDFIILERARRTREDRIRMDVKTIV